MSKASPKSRVKTIKAINYEIRKSRRIIAKERDRLLRYMADLKEMTEDLDEGIECLDQAIDIFSYKQ